MLRRFTPAMNSYDVEAASPQQPGGASAIGKLRSREDLLESILLPSRRIEPKYAAYLVQTTDGRTFTGLLVKRDEKSVVLRDGQNKETTLAANEVELMRPSVTSLRLCSSFSGVTPEIDWVMPSTVPRKPRIGIAQVMKRVRA